jgi:hypothetical protein
MARRRPPGAAALYGTCRTMSIKDFFQRPHYVSDATQFIESLKKANPDLEAEQRAGRGLLWDRPRDRALMRDFEAARVPQKPYVYQNES